MFGKELSTIESSEDFHGATIEHQPGCVKGGILSFGLLDRLRGLGQHVAVDRVKVGREGVKM